jgi:hypothetical protein
MLSPPPLLGPHLPLQRPAIRNPFPPSVRIFRHILVILPHFNLLRWHPTRFRLATNKTKYSHKFYTFMQYYFMNFMNISRQQCLKNQKVQQMLTHRQRWDRVVERYAHNSFLRTWAIPHNLTHFSIIINKGFQGFQGFPHLPGFSRVFQGLGFIVPLGFRV